MYHNENLTRLKKMNALAPEVMKAFWAFDKLAVADGAIPVKYKELIAVAVALTTQCPYCIDIPELSGKVHGRAGNVPEAFGKVPELSIRQKQASKSRLGLGLLIRSCSCFTICRSRKKHRTCEVSRPQESQAQRRE